MIRLQVFSYGLVHFAGPSLASFSFWDRPWWLKAYPKSSGVIFFIYCWIIAWYGVLGKSIHRIDDTLEWGTRFGQIIRLLGHSGVNTAYWVSQYGVLVNMAYWGLQIRLLEDSGVNTAYYQGQYAILVNIAYQESRYGVLVFGQTYVNLFPS